MALQTVMLPVMCALSAFTDQFVSDVEVVPLRGLLHMVKLCFLIIACSCILLGIKWNKLYFSYEIPYLLVAFPY